ncbi:carbamoyl transferase, partial [Candidatus Thiomargarita nelsonii]
MIILGISEEADAGVSLIQNGKIIFAINEERLTRIKLQAEFPHNALKSALVYLETQHLTHQLKGIALASEIHIGIPKKATFARQILGGLSHIGIASLILGTTTGIKTLRFLYQKMQFKRLLRIRNTLVHYGLDQLPLKVYDHHFCHACSAYFTSNYSKCLTITIDAAGDGYCSKVYECTDGNMKLLHSIPFFHSIGYYYTLVTQILGFTKGG